MVVLNVVHAAVELFSNVETCFSAMSLASLIYIRWTSLLINSEFLKNKELL